MPKAQGVRHAEEERQLSKSNTILYCKKTISKKLSNMKFLGITLSLLTASSCNAFAPTIIGVSRAQALNAETLEGWKIDGKIKPVNNFILIRKKENAVETDSGILISDKVCYFLLKDCECCYIYSKHLI